MLGYHQLSHKGCVYETDEKDKVEETIIEAINNGLTGLQIENFKKHIAQLCKYYLYRDFADSKIKYGKTIDDLCSWLKGVMVHNAQSLMQSKVRELLNTEIYEKENEQVGRFTLELSLKERIDRRMLKANLSSHQKIYSIICRSISENTYEDTMMLISQIDSTYLEEKQWEHIFSEICQSFICDRQESFENFLLINMRLNEEVRTRLKIDILLKETIKSQIVENKITEMKWEFDNKYMCSQKLFWEELDSFIGDLINRMEFKLLYDLADNFEADAAHISYVMELIFKNNYFDRILMKKWMHILLQSDDVETLYYFGIMELDRILFLYPECIYNDYYRDRNSLLYKTSELLNANQKWEKGKIKTGRTIAIIVVGLHGRNFASTRLQVGLANRLNADGWKVTLYVADTNYISSNKKFIVNPSTVRHNFSKEIYQKDHWEMIDIGVEVKYFNQKEDDADRYRRLIKTIYEDNPRAVIDITNEQGIYNIQLIKDFPVISVPLNGYITSSTASCYIARDISYVHKMESIYGKIDAQKTAEANLYLPYSIDNEKFDRKNYGFIEKDILVVTVGNRLNYEITKQVQEKMKQLLAENNKIKWVVVGAINKSNFEVLSDEILKKQVILWGYESQLYKLYRMCDIYLDLPRSGGGGSTALAVQCGLPAIIVRSFSDIIPFLGEENAVKSFDDSLDLLRELVQSRVKRKQINKMEYQRLMAKRFSIDNFAKVIADEIIGTGR